MNFKEQAKLKADIPAVFLAMKKKETPAAGRKSSQSFGLGQYLHQNPR